MTTIQTQSLYTALRLSGAHIQVPLVTTKRSICWQCVSILWVSITRLYFKRPLPVCTFMYVKGTSHTHQRWEPQSWWLYYASLLQQANKTSDVTQLNPGGKLDKRPPMANLNPAHTQACTWAMMHMLPTEINKSHPDRTAGMDKVDRGHLEPVKTIKTRCPSPILYLQLSCF